ncbi:hypothetical protein AA313_de0200406 [Arthrobotrys entomopaga]|nr:hypothetical protein AA313_de0200406 [Arthrobotrys entomopaga]
MTADASLLTAAIGALVGCRVVTYDEHLRNPKRFQPLDVEAFHKSVLVAPPSRLLMDSASSGPSTSNNGRGFLLGYLTGALITRRSNQAEPLFTDRLITVFVRTLSGRTVTITANLSDTVATLKEEIAEKADVPPEDQRLVYAGKELEDQYNLHFYGISDTSTIHLALRILGGATAMYLPPDYLDPAYDWDFTTTKDGAASFSRGGEKYVRPCGWKRYALKVNGKYGSDVWLGSSDARGEWPVSYHGTGLRNAESIAEEGYKLAKSYNFVHGVGIYSSPSHSIAEAYAKDFPYQGKRYKIIFQNRVNPDSLNKIPNIDYWVSPADADIRPYGLCIKEA